LRTETEQLLYYSIPGFFVFFFVFLFLIVIGNTAILDVRGITFIVAAVIPVGFIVYQAYVLTLYERIWYGDFFKISDPCKEFFKSYISEALGVLNPKLVRAIEKHKDISWLHIHIFRLHEQENMDVIDYSWRLINLINARGVGAFTCVLALFVPVSYVMFLYASAILLGLPLPGLPNYETTVMAILYYISIAVFIFVLIRGIPRIKKHLSDLNLEVLISKSENLEQFILAYVSVKVVCRVKDILSKEEKSDENSKKLIEKAFENLRKREWKDALETASKAYNKSKQSKSKSEEISHGRRNDLRD
jgi:hypothetical protein